MRLLGRRVGDVQVYVATVIGAPDLAGLTLPPEPFVSVVSRDLGPATDEVLAALRTGRGELVCVDALDGSGLGHDLAVRALESLGYGQDRVYTVALLEDAVDHVVRTLATPRRQGWEGLSVVVVGPPAVTAAAGAHLGVAGVSPDGHELAGLLPTVPSLLGLSGAPGVGKSTLAAALVASYGGVVVPMDGFHLADVELVRRALLDRKGAPETFDAEGYAALLARVREGAGTVMAPVFDRTLEQPVAGALAVPPSASLVVTEGNYLLLDGAWARVRAQLDEVWHVVCDPVVRLERLVARHVEFGKSPAEARAWVDRVDEPNAALVEASSSRADLVLDVTDWMPPAG